jgi:RimJ/RimL family protein N-acetyltransferase
MASAFDDRWRQPTLRGERVRIDPLRAEDWEPLFAVARDPLLWAQHPQPDRWREPVFRAFFEEALASGGALRISERATGRAIGSSRWVWHDEAAGEIEIGWTFLARDHWGGVTNGEVKRLMIEHALAFARRVRFFVGLENLRSQRALEKIGAVQRANERNRAGRMSASYEVTAASWRAGGAGA